ncbi:MAG: hypothetical protein QXI60_09065 [Thermofilaceae archaeon]
MSVLVTGVRPAAAGLGFRFTTKSRAVDLGRSGCGSVMIPRISRFFVPHVTASNMSGSFWLIVNRNHLDKRRGWHI